MDKAENMQNFRLSGLLVFTNIFLNIFGWAVVAKGDCLLPVRSSLKGFPDDVIIEAYEKITDYNCGMAEATRIKGDFNIYGPDRD